MDRTRWRQAPGSRAQGHSALYAFHQALERRVPRPQGTATDADAIAREGFRRMFEERFAEAAEAFQVAQDRYEEAGDPAAAVYASEMAREALEDAGRDAGLTREVMIAEHALTYWLRGAVESGDWNGTMQQARRVLTLGDYPWNSWTRSVSWDLARLLLAASTERPFLIPRHRGSNPPPKRISPYRQEGR